MHRTLIQIILLLFWITGISPNNSHSVHQTPADLLWEIESKVKLTCKHSINNYDTVLWYQRSGGDSTLKLVAYTSYTRVQVVEKDFQGSFNVSGDGEKEAVLHLLKLRHPEDNSNRIITTPTVRVLPPSKSECRNNKDMKNKKTLVCVASGFYPDHLSVFWQVDRVNVTDGVATDSAALWEGEHYSISSRLRVPLSEWFTPGRRFTCTVGFFNRNQTVYTSDWVEGVKGPGAAAIREKYLRVTHMAKLSYVVLNVKSIVFGVFVVFLVWKLQGSSGKHKD